MIPGVTAEFPPCKQALVGPTDAQSTVTKDVLCDGLSMPQRDPVWRGPRTWSEEEFATPGRKSQKNSRVAEGTGPADAARGWAVLARAFVSPLAIAVR